MPGEHALSADLDFEDGDWDVEGTDYEEEFREAVETVRDDHDQEVLVEADSLYYLNVRWNDPTDTIRFDVLALTEVFEVPADEEGDAS